MDISEQREVIDRLIGSLWADGRREDADAVRTAWAELEVWRRAFASDAPTIAETRGAADVALSEGGAQDPTPEVYVYRVLFQDYGHDGSMTWESERIQRSTPLLTWEDLESLRLELASRRHALDVKIIDYVPLRG